MPAKRRIALTLGDVNGIGPEIVAKLLQRPGLRRVAEIVIVGDGNQLSQALGRVGARQVEPPVWQGGSLPGGLAVHDLANVEAGAVTLGRGSAAGARAGVSALLAAVDLAKQGEVGAVVYAPLHKRSLPVAGYQVRDELHLLKQHLGWRELAGEVNIVRNLWTARVTSHIPLSQVASRITVECITEVTRMLWVTMKQAGSRRVRLAVAALNPHGGEGGLFGSEELTVITPAVEVLHKEGIEVAGPLPADTVFMRAIDGEFDGVVGMYHDQVQIATKTWSRGRGTTLLAGFPFPILTPAHGTAFDLAGTGRASDEGLWRTVRLAGRLLLPSKG